jgi:motility quorum-sensing regulator/GCU-specific mRNA interferase toxin
VTEKRKPHHDLSAIQTLVVELGMEAFTKSALDGGLDMGLTDEEMLAVIASLDSSCFYKSMTTYRNHKEWQDVYHAVTPGQRIAYIKIALRDLALVISFKELES